MRQCEEHVAGEWGVRGSHLEEFLISYDSILERKEERDNMRLIDAVEKTIIVSDDKGNLHTIMISSS